MVIGSSGLRDSTKEVRTVGDLKRYVDDKGRMRSLTEEHAKKLGGYTLAEQQDPKDEPESGPEAAAPEGAQGEPARGTDGESVVVAQPANDKPTGDAKAQADAKAKGK